MVGCTKRYTDPSSLRKHVKSHTQEEQLQYRRTKDQVNQAKRSSSPGLRQQIQKPTFPVTSTMGAHCHSSSTSTLLSVGLHAGGTVLTIDDPAAAAMPSNVGLTHNMAGHEKRSISQQPTTTTTNDSSNKHNNNINKGNTFYI